MEREGFSSSAKPDEKGPIQRHYLIVSIYEALAESTSGAEQELAQSGCIADIRILDIGAMEEGEER